MNTDDNLHAELTRALDQMTEMTCPSMRPLWLEATKRARKKYFDEPAPDFPDHLEKSPKFKTQYKTLAAWRHGVVWQEFHTPDPPEVTADQVELDPELEPDDVEDYPDYAATMRAIYFTECPDEAPFSHSNKKSESPEIDATYSEATTIRECVKACWTTLHLLQIRWWNAEGGPKSEFLHLSIKNGGTLDDLLKFSDYRKKTVGTNRYEWNGPTPISELQEQ